MDLLNTYYIIFDVSELNKVNFDIAIEDNQSTVRTSVDGTKTFINWLGETVPSFVNNINSKSQVYPYLEFLEVLNSNEWSIMI
jgi:hypothetical protein